MGPLTASDRDADLAARGADGAWAAALDRRVEQLLPTVSSLSELTTYLALDYLERVQRPWPALTLAVGVRLVTRAYVAHLAVEADPVSFGAFDVPVMGAFPAARHGRPPADLLTRVVKASRRGFDTICALSAGTWEGYVTCIVYRAEQDAAADAGGDTEGAGGERGGLDRALVDGLARVGWILRQVDIFYEQAPERTI